MARGVRQWVAIGLGLYTCAAIAGTCYVTIEVLRLRDTAQNVAIGGGLVVLLAPVLYLLWRLSPEGVQVARQDDFERRERERIEARIRHPDHAHVGVDGAEREVGGRYPGLGQGIE